MARSGFCLRLIHVTEPLFVTSYCEIQLDSIGMSQKNIPRFEQRRTGKSRSVDTWNQATRHCWRPLCPDHVSRRSQVEFNLNNKEISKDTWLVNQWSPLFSVPSHRNSINSIIHQSVGHRFENDWHSASMKIPTWPKEVIIFHCLSNLAENN